MNKAKEIKSTFDESVCEKIETYAKNKDCENKKLKLAISIVNNDLSLATKLLEHRVDPNIVYTIHEFYDGNAPLGLKPLIDGLGLDLNSFYKKDGFFDGITPLALAALTGTNEMTSLLIKYGANINQKLKDNRIAAHYAAFGDNLNTIELLSGCNTSNINTTSLANEWNSLFHLATSKSDENNTAIASHLIGCGIDKNAHEYAGGNKRIIHFAAAKGKLAIMEELVKSGVNTDIGTPEENSTSLMYAVIHNQTKIINYLLSQNTNVNIINKFGMNALFYAVQGGELEIVKQLVAAKIDLTIQEELTKLTVLNMANIYKKTDIVKFLESHNAPLTNLYENRNITYQKNLECNNKFLSVGLISTPSLNQVLNWIFPEPDNIILKAIFASAGGKIIDSFLDFLFDISLHCDYYNNYELNRCVTNKQFYISNFDQVKVMLDNYHNIYLTPEEKCYSNDNLLGKIYLSGIEFNACHINCPISFDYFAKHYEHTNNVVSFSAYLNLALLTSTLNINYKLITAASSLVIDAAVFSYEHFFVVKEEPDCHSFNNLYAKNLVHKTAPLELESSFKKTEKKCYYHMREEAEQFHEGGMKSHSFDEEQTKEVMFNKESCIKKHELLNEKCEKYYGPESVIEKKDYVPEFCYDANYFGRQYALRDIKWDFVESGKAKYDLPEFKAEEPKKPLSYYEYFIDFFGLSSDHSHHNISEVEL